MGKVKEQLWKEPEFDYGYPYFNETTEQETDMKLSQLVPSTGKYIKKEDVEPAILVTISGFSREDVSAQNEPADMKAIVHFNEDKKPLVLNQTNAQLLAVACGLSYDSDESEYIGKKIVLWNDKTVSFGGKVTGGVRIRAPKNQQPAQTQPAVEFEEELPEPF